MSTHDELPASAIERLLADARPLLDEPALLYGRYRLLRELGRGAMGVVHEAEDLALRRRVALKVLALPAQAGPGLAEQVLREARAAARLDHPNIAAVYDAHDGAIAMRFVDGVLLSALPRDDARRLVALVRDAALAVQHAHEHGIVHRDLKPGNLMVEVDRGAGERVVVTDFGLAKELTLDAAATAHASVSTAGSVLGTPSYMPPEQAAGRAGDVDARSDVYALGATLYDLLARRPPFVDRHVVSLLRRVIEEDPPPLRSLAPAVPRDLALIVHKCMAKEKDRRYTTAAELADDLTRWLDGRAVHATAPTLRYRAGKLVRRHRALFAATAAVLVIVAGALAATWAERTQRRVTEAALALSEEIHVLRRNASLHLRLPEEHPLAIALLDRGIAACRDLLARHDVAQGHLQLGRLLRARGRLDEARGAFDRALLLDPRLLAARLERGLLHAERHFADLAADAGSGAASAHAEQALEDLAVVEADAGAFGRIDVELGRAQLARLRGDLDAAVRGFQAVLGYDDLFAAAEAHVAIAQIEARRGHPEAARRSAMSAIDLQLGNGAVYVARLAGAGAAGGEEAVGDGAVERAVRQLEHDAARLEHDRDVEARPFDAEARARRGFHLVEVGAAEEGRADLEAALFLGVPDELGRRIREALAGVAEPAG